MIAEHHLVTVYAITNAVIDLLSTQPESDIILEAQSLMESQFDILHCMVNHRHYGSDGLDSIIHDCTTVVEQVEELRKK